MSWRSSQAVVAKKASTTIKATKIMRLGLAAFSGTLAPCSTVKAGVRSCIRALAACSWVLKVV